eukprot:6638229-Prymnesium_polylepis.1
MEHLLLSHQKEKNELDARHRSWQALCKRDRAHSMVMSAQLLHTCVHASGRVPSRERLVESASRERLVRRVSSPE